MIYTDNNTGKQYSINGLTITQTRDGVKLGETAMPTAGALLHWLEMMGFKPVSANAVGVRLVQNKSFSYGKQSYSVEARNVVVLDAITAQLCAMGWRDECTNCEEDNGYEGEGVTMEFAVSCGLADEFRRDFQIVKATLK